MAEWAELNDDHEVLRNGKIITTRQLSWNDLVYRITHSHHHEYADLTRYGYDSLYRKSRFTAAVSIGWHLAGRYEYDTELIKHLERNGWPKLKLVDFGAACWLQAIFYAKKGLTVDVVNQDLESDANRFGAWLAAKHGVSSITQWNSSVVLEPAWKKNSYDIIYAVDVFEHIPPDGDKPGWIPYAEQLLASLKPGGIWFVNAPFGYGDGPPTPVESHPVHFSSSIQMSHWNATHGIIQEGYLWRKL